MCALSPTALLRLAVRLLVPLALLLSTYLYLYPVFGQCAFPLPTSGPHRPPAGHNGTASARAGFVETLKLHLVPGYDGPSTRPLADSPLAPFRLLALGDPQLEGDTSIPNAYSNSSFPHLRSAYELATFARRQRDGSGEEEQGDEPGDDDDDAGEDDNAPPDPDALVERVRLILHDLVDVCFLDMPLAFASARKRLDLFGNDYYLAHIYRTMRWWTVPTHMTVLGDLLGSQWVDDDEFSTRAARYWERVVRGAERVPDDVASAPLDAVDAAGELGAPPRTDAAQDAWTRRVINVAGNHDIGYAGDITDERLARFERQFGRANYALRFALPLARLSAGAADKVSSDHLAPELRIVNLNDMNLDTPAADAKLQDQTYAFLNDVINTAAPVEAQGHFTVLLTHVPLYKPAGLCVDAPYFAFHDDDGTLREQNQLSEDASRGFLQGVLGMHGDATAPGAGRGRRGVILNGHDHEGCDSYHYVNQSQPAPLTDNDDDDGAPRDRRWETARFAAAQADGLVGRAGFPGVREITVRSMMGDFGGNAGLLSAWFDEATWSWQFAYATCALGPSYVWWVVHVVDVLAAGACLAYGVVVAVAAITGKAAAASKKDVTKDVVASKEHVTSKEAVAGTKATKVKTEKA